jgi:transketolase
MALSRQKTPAWSAPSLGGNLSAKGAYEVAAAEGEAQVTIFASGSEVPIALAARPCCRPTAWPTRVVSTPCWELFEQQTPKYRAETIGKAPGPRRRRGGGQVQGWERFIGEDGVFVGMTGFGASAPAERLYKEFGITAEAVGGGGEGEAGPRLRRGHSLLCRRARIRTERGR